MMVNNSTSVPPPSSLSQYHLTFSSKNLTETGGLLRIGIKLMMACCTTNIDVYVLLLIQVQLIKMIIFTLPPPSLIAYDR